MFKIGIITDEVSQDFEEALKFVKENGMDCVELRSAWERNPFEFTDEDIDKIKDLLDKYNLPLVCISSPFFKCDFNDLKTRNEHIEGLKRVISYSDKLGFKMIRCFDFVKDDSITKEQIKEAYQEPIRLCEEAGITIALESEPSANSYDNARTAEFVKFLDTPTVRALYEPGNTFYTDSDEIPYPDGYMAVKDVFCHIHFKDAIRRNGKTTGTAIGSGDVDYIGVVRELMNSDYNGCVILEPHYKPNMEMPEELLFNPRGSAISLNGDIASKECIDALKGIIQKIKDEK